MFQLYFQLGFNHLTELGAWDHQLFLATIALAYSPYLWRRWIALATIFALGHSISLVAIAFGLVPTQLTWVETAIVSSLIFMAVYELWALRQNPFSVSNPTHLSSGFLRLSSKPIVLMVAAGIFGLVHGLGFGASFVSVMMPEVSSFNFALSLLAFTIGVESAQLLILLLLWVFAFALFGLLQWRPLLLRRLLLVAIAVIATFHLLA